MDVVFLIDTTGSMADEIEVVKEKMRDMVAQIASGDPAPRVRFGLVLYRDRGDEYVTKVIELTDDIDAMVAHIAEVQAAGGGDEPESLNEALHVALHDMNWDPAEEVDKTVFLIADAPPHMDYEGDYQYAGEVEYAVHHNIIIHSIGCSGLSEEGNSIFRQIAQGSEGTFNLLTYKREYVTADGTTETVLEAGGRVFGIMGEPGAAADADWRVGAERLEEAGAARAIAAAPVPPATAAPGGAMGGGMMGGMGGMGGTAMGAATENNLDSILAGTLRKQAERRGVRYADTGTLEIVARYTGTRSGIHEALRQVIRTEDEWKALWERHTQPFEPRPELPQVDFGKSMLIVVFSGEKPTGGHSVRVETVRETKDGLDVTFRVTKPDEGMMTTQAFTQPYDIVVVDNTEGELRFLEAE
ncbi:MAG TPA: protease complex subunit PrcB family protein [Armatimonadota bacterium]|nr:protease complex subunit PrcB family protein [Armatimonadota bacterium]